MVNPGRADERRIPAKATNYHLKAGDVISLRTANSAGYGNPRERDPALVLRDTLDEVITAQEAADVYGVHVDVECESVVTARRPRNRRESSR